MLISHEIVEEILLMIYTFIDNFPLLHTTGYASASLAWQAIEKI